MLDVGVIYDSGSRTARASAGPLVRLSWEGAEAATEQISAGNLQAAGETLTLALMLLARERQY